MPKARDMLANAIAARLDQLDQRANRLRVPTAYASAVYTLRSYIDLVRERLSMSADRKPEDVFPPAGEEDEADVSQRLPSDPES